MRQLKKVVYALTESALRKNIQSHENRGWVVASEVKPHGYGVAVLMKWGEESPIERRA